jgi:hypothetical protein
MKGLGSETHGLAITEMRAVGSYFVLEISYRMFSFKIQY